MKLSCEIVRDLVGVCTDCAASDETKASVQEHLADCPACARYYVDYKRIGDTHRSSGRHTKLSEDAGYRELSMRLRRKRNTEIAATAAAMLATAAVAILIFRAVTGRLARSSQGEA